MINQDVDSSFQLGRVRAHETVVVVLLNDVELTLDIRFGILSGCQLVSHKVGTRAVLEKTSALFQEVSTHVARTAVPHGQAGKGGVVLKDSFDRHDTTKAVTEEMNIGAQAEFLDHLMDVLA